MVFIFKNLPKAKIYKDYVTIPEYSNTTGDFMISKNENKTYPRRPLMFQVDSINEEKRTLERNKLMVENPIGGSFKVSNGKYLCEISLSEHCVRLKCSNKNGHTETISTKMISA